MTNKGKIKARKSKIPADFDISALDYLEYGDCTRVAKQVNAHPVYVSKVRKEKIFNVTILSALIKKGNENRKRLTAK